MVTDIHSNYTSPAGREFTLAAGRFSGVNPGSRVLDIGCGYGAGACNIAAEFRSRVTAVDINGENIDFAREHAAGQGVSHLIDFKPLDILKADFSDQEEPFDLALAEGGILSFIGRRRGLELIRPWLCPRGWISFSDLILLGENIPTEILSIFDHGHFKYETEAGYRALVKECGYSVQFVSLVLPSGWDNYYAHMARRLEDSRGFFADQKIKLAFHKEIDVFYRLEALKHVGYLVCIARRTD
jgi:SAM-dependent methyltransferase